MRTGSWKIWVLFCLLSEPLCAQDAAMTSVSVSPAQSNPSLTGEEEAPWLNSFVSQSMALSGERFCDLSSELRPESVSHAECVGRGSDAGSGGEWVQCHLGTGPLFVQCPIFSGCPSSDGPSGGIFPVSDQRQSLYILRRSSGRRLLGGSVSFGGSRWVPDLSAGLSLFYKDVLYGGVSVFHINSPPFTFLSGAGRFRGAGSGRLGRRFVVHGGMDLSLIRSTLLTRRRIVWVSLLAMYQQQDGFRKVSGGADLHYHSVSGGLWLSRSNGLKSVLPTLSLGWAKRPSAHGICLRSTGIWRDFRVRRFPRNHHWLSITRRRR